MFKHYYVQHKETKAQYYNSATSMILVFKTTSASTCHVFCKAQNSQIGIKQISNVFLSTKAPHLLPLIVSKKFKLFLYQMNSK